MKKKATITETIKKLEEHMKYLDKFISRWQDNIISTRRRMDSLEKYLNIEYKNEPDNTHEYPKHRKIRRSVYPWCP